MTEDGTFHPAASTRPLRALTYLAPGIPLEFFELVTEHLARALECEIELGAETRSSGPMHGDFDPFGEGRADIGFLCSPSYLYLSALERPSIHLVPAAFVFRDGRHSGEPVYFSEVVVRAGDAARRFTDLAGRVWGFNDECSLSGYFAALQQLDALRCGEDFFAQRVRTGSHHASIEALLDGRIDAASIDSTVLSHLLRERRDLPARLRVLDSWGPFPIQPVVVSRRLGARGAERVAAGLLSLPDSSPGLRRLSGYGLERCAPIDDTAYAEERRALISLGELPTRPPHTST